MRASRPRYGSPLGQTDSKDKASVTPTSEWERFFDELAQGAVKATARAGDTTPSVKGLGDRGVLELANTAPTSVTGLDDGLELQEVVLLCSNGNTTFVHSAALRLSGAANVTPAANSTLAMKLIDGVWRQVAPVVTA